VIQERKVVKVLKIKFWQKQEKKQETRKFLRQYCNNECNKNIYTVLILLEIFSSDLKNFRNCDYLKRCKIPSKVEREDG